MISLVETSAWDRFPTAANALARPAAHTPLIGRDSVLADLIQRVNDPNNRLLTLVGPGGVGKTRLAVELLERTEELFGGRAWFVPLAAVNSPSKVGEEIAWALAGRAAGAASPIDAAGRALGAGRALLVLDNFEHVIGASGFVLDLLSDRPELQVLITSRELLRVRSEIPVSIPPLATGALDQVSESPSDAVELFLDRLNAVRPGFVPGDADLAAIGEICRQLDGLPLAIELAAARCRALTPIALQARLGDRLGLLTRGPRDLPERQRGMRATIAWSYELLHEQDRGVFRRLGVFASSFTLDAAETVLTAGSGDDSVESVEPVMVLDGISSLLDKSLLLEFTGSDGDQRFSFLAVIREFARELLIESGEAETIYRRHAAWADKRAVECWNGIYRQEFDHGWFPRLEIEHDDFRATLNWLESQGDGAAMLRIACNLTPFWFFHSHRREGADWLERALMLVEFDALPIELRAQTTHCQGLLLQQRGGARQILRTSMELWREAGDPWGIGTTAITIAANLTKVRQFEEASRFNLEAIECFRGVSEIWYGAGCLDLGVCYLGLGRVAEAKAQIELAIDAAATAADWYGLGLALVTKAYVELAEGDLASCREALDRALEPWQQLEMLEGFASVFAVAAGLAAERGEAKSAALLIGASEMISERIEYSFSHFEQDALVRARDLSQRALPAEFDVIRQAGRDLTTYRVVEIAASVGRDPAARAARPQAQDGEPNLTPREIEVLRLLSEGRSDREIGESLFISRATAARHVANIFLKLDINSRTAAAAYAFRQGLTSK